MEQQPGQGPVQQQFAAVPRETGAVPIVQGAQGGAGQHLQDPDSDAAKAIGKDIMVSNTVQIHHRTVCCCGGAAHPVLVVMHALTNQLSLPLAVVIKY
jgi:hypothetical protein